MRKDKYPGSLRSDSEMAKLLIVGRNVWNRLTGYSGKVDGFSGIGKNKRYFKEISDFNTIFSPRTF
jgi:hypothetical protein